MKTYNFKNGAKIEASTGKFTVVIGAERSSFDNWAQAQALARSAKFSGRMVSTTVEQPSTTFYGGRYLKMDPEQAIDQIDEELSELAQFIAEQRGIGGAWEKDADLYNALQQVRGQILRGG